MRVGMQGTRYRDRAPGYAAASMTDMLVGLFCRFTDGDQLAMSRRPTNSETCRVTRIKLPNLRSIANNSGIGVNQGASARRLIG
jgi:hypothetical protein